MDFYELVRSRYSVRAYRPDAVPDDKLERVLEAARLAPTACNLQPFRIIVAQTRGRESELGRLYPAGWFVQAPLVIVVCTVASEAWVRRADDKNHAEIDAAIAMDHLILAATNEGLATCWIAAFDPLAAVEVLGLPNGVTPVVMTPLGYAADSPREKSRKPMSELVRRERW